MKNRALEFLANAEAALMPGLDGVTRAYIQMARAEVEELMERITLYEMSDMELQRRVVVMQPRAATLRELEGK